jgi:hypothetical protein
MSSNLLKLNQDKTELIVFAPKNRVKQMSDFKLPFFLEKKHNLQVKWSFPNLEVTREQTSVL